MTAKHVKGCVAIDTNVFVHLLNPQHNVDLHITKLLTYLHRQDIDLIVDDTGRISTEYTHHLIPIVRNSDDTRIEIYILRYWMLLAPRQEVVYDGNSRLAIAIRQVIVERKEIVDQIFAYVAFEIGKTLISNDQRHIVIGPPRESRESSRRRRLLRATRRMRPDGANILTSKEAHSSIP